MDIFAEIQKLGLKQDEYVVVSGGVLVALGLLPDDEDVDIAVTPEIFQRFQQQGWEKGDWQGKLVLRRGVYDVGIGFGPWSLGELQRDALYIQGIPFMNPEKLLTWKLQIGRPKDLQHAALIRTYLARQRPK